MIGLNMNDPDLFKKSSKYIILPYLKVFVTTYYYTMEKSKE